LVKFFTFANKKSWEREDKRLSKTKY